MKWYDARVEPPPLGKHVLLKGHILEGYFMPERDYKPNWCCEGEHFGSFAGLPFYITLDEIELEIEKNE
jgi:hypothetical protein